MVDAFGRSIAADAEVLGLVRRRVTESLQRAEVEFGVNVSAMISLGLTLSSISRRAMRTDSW